MKFRGGGVRQNAPPLNRPPQQPQQRDHRPPSLHTQVRQLRHAVGANLPALCVHDVRHPRGQLGLRAQRGGDGLRVLKERRKTPDSTRHYGKKPGTAPPPHADRAGSDPGRHQLPATTPLPPTWSVGGAAIRSSRATTARSDCRSTAACAARHSAGRAGALPSLAAPPLLPLALPACRAACWSRRRALRRGRSRWRPRRMGPRCAAAASSAGCRARSGAGAPAAGLCVHTGCRCCVCCWGIGCCADGGAWAAPSLAGASAASARQPAGAEASAAGPGSRRRTSTRPSVCFCCCCCCCCGGGGGDGSSAGSGCLRGRPRLRGSTGVCRAATAPRATTTVALLALLLGAERSATAALRRLAAAAADGPMPAPASLAAGLRLAASGPPAAAPPPALFRQRGKGFSWRHPAPYALHHAL